MVIDSCRCSNLIGVVEHDHGMVIDVVALLARLDFLDLDKLLPYFTLYGGVGGQTGRQSRTQMGAPNGCQPTCLSYELTQPRTQTTERQNGGV